MTTTTHAAETEREAIVRLTAKARSEGVQITRDHNDGRFYASSVSRPGTRHYVTALSCTCLGFCRHQRCGHHSLLLAAIGWLDDDDDPDPDPPPPPAPAAIAVHHIPGHWTTGGWLRTNDCPEWHAPVTEIALDGEDVLRVCGDQFDVAVHWLEGGKPIDDLTSATPSGVSHRRAVEYWIRALAANNSANTDALLFAANIPEDYDAWDDMPDRDDDDDELEEEVA